MRVGLIRHFPVQQPMIAGWRTAAELHHWRKLYDASPAIEGAIDLGLASWKTCLCSDLDRAVVTAKKAFTGNIEFTALLREAEFDEFQTGRLRLTPSLWKWVFRFAWMSGHRSQRRRRDEFHQRVRAVADVIERRDPDVLVVSHGGMMVYLSQELGRRGFSGPKLRMPKHAFLYLYERVNDSGVQRTSA